MDDILKEDVFDHERGPIDLLDEREVDLSKLTKDAKVLIQTLSAAHPAEQIRIYQADPLHATYIDESETTVDTDALKTIQKAGYAITGAGTERPLGVEQSDFDDNAQRVRAAVEFEPRRDVFDG